MMRRFTAVWFTTVLLCALPALSQVRSEYRAFWVDTFNTTLNNHNDVVAVVNNARAAKANAVFAQVRRRGDSWYLNSLEPAPQGVAIQTGFDALQDLIAEAHANGIEVHAFVIVCAVSDNNPTVNPLLNPNHVFNNHGGYDPASGTIIPGPNNWLTRTLLPTAATFQGHRFGATFWIDLGHPEAAQYTFDVLMHLVRNYDIDGLHLDRIRYPEFAATGQTPSAGTNIGYNTTNVERFNTYYGLPAGSNPPPSDNNWKQWRRDQVTNFVRRIYLNAIAIKANIRVSGSFIAFGGGPTTEAGWLSAEAYWRVYQDWRAWTEEGIVDMAIPMAYKREHTAAEVTQYDQWSEWLKNHQYRRSGLVGIGNFLNAVEGSVRQTRRAIAPSAAGNNAAGVSFFSMATSNVAVTANPFAQPAPANTPLRSFAEFASGLTTGRSVSGLTSYENTTTNPVAIFANAATIPNFAWKSAPLFGHLMGIAQRPLGSALDTGAVTVRNVGAGGATRTTATDGNGFFGAVDLAPGRYHAKVQLGTEVVYSCFATVVAGTVATADALLVHPPGLAAPADLTVPADAGSCSARVEVGVPVISDTCGDAAADFVRSDGATDLSTPFAKGTTTITWRLSTVDGSLTAPQTITVVDAEGPAITGLSTDETTLWPPNHKMVKVKVSYNTADNCSGAVTTSLTVTSNEPVDGNGDGDTAPDWEVLDNHTVRLRAERAGGGNGRIYTITVTATDSSGNASTSSVNVTVAHDKGKGNQVP